MSQLHAITVYVPDRVWLVLQADARRHRTTIPDAIVDTLERAAPMRPRAHPGRGRAVPEFARLVGQERERRGWSYQALARRAEVDASLIWRYEAGQRAPSRYTVGALVAALQLPPTEATAFYRAAGFVWEEVAHAS